MSKKSAHKPWEIIDPAADLFAEGWGFYAPILPKNALENKVYSIKLIQVLGFSRKQEAQAAAKKHKEKFLEELDTKVSLYRNVVAKLDRYRATIAKDVILENKTEGFVFKTEKFGPYHYYLKFKNKYFISKSPHTHRSDATRLFNTFGVRIAKNTITDAELKAFHTEITLTDLMVKLRYHNRTAKK